MSRKNLSPAVETEILSRSRRRCCVCFGLNRDISEKRGQIAHLDQDSSNNKPDNLAFLCLDHHDQYDGRTRQSKGFTETEVKRYRTELYDFFQRDSHAQEQRSDESMKKLIPTPDRWTEDHEDALAFHVGTHRSQSVVLAVAESPKTIEEINRCIPPHDLEWTKTILSGVIGHGWVQRTETRVERYELSDKGRRMLKALDEIPESAKKNAWKQAWQPDSKD